MNKHEKTIDTFGTELCLEAFDLHNGGEGAFTVGVYLDIYDKLGRVNVRRSDALIDAGRWLRETVKGDYADNH